MIRRIEFAEHEAGHAVVAEFLGLKVRAVQLIATEDFSGVCYLARPAPRARRLHDALVDAAGPAADILVGRAPRGRRKALDSWEGDFAAIKRAGFSAKEREVLVFSATAMLRGPCAVAWARVWRALQDQDLTGDQVRAAFLGPIPDLD